MRVYTRALYSIVAGGTHPDELRVTGTSLADAQYAGTAPFLRNGCQDCITMQRSVRRVYSHTL